MHTEVFGGKIWYMQITLKGLKNQMDLWTERGTNGNISVKASTVIVNYRIWVVYIWIFTINLFNVSVCLKFYNKILGGII